MKVSILTDISEIEATRWNAVSGTDYPFLRHEFLHALERCGCVGEQHGWLPHHITIEDDSGQLCGLAPLYLKDNSYGEFVFDWSWADASQRAGLHYYPKLVSAIPFTPVTGTRIATAAGSNRDEITQLVVNTALALAETTGASSLHWLFTDSGETAQLEQLGHMRRTGCNFHWQNDAYASFDDFLARLSSRKRKKIRRERRRVAEARIRMEIRNGHDMSEDDWRVMHGFYSSTFDRKWGMATLTRAFFSEISRTMGDQLVLVFAYLEDQPVAGAIMLRSSDALYGRHWGCIEDHHSLHFETCYYQGIDYCIRHGLRLFDPGVQGEHKISRGFLPTYTWSAHWIHHPGLRDAVGDFLLKEQAAMADYHDDLLQVSPYRSDCDQSGAR